MLLPDTLCAWSQLGNILFGRKAIGTLFLLPLSFVEAGFISENTGIALAFSVEPANFNDLLFSLLDKNSSILSKTSKSGLETPLTHLSNVLFGTPFSLEIFKSGMPLLLIFSIISAFVFKILYFFSLHKKICAFREIVFPSLSKHG